MKVVATYSIKGGVGKTTTAVNFAHEAARHGVRVLLWDLDPQAAATFLLRIRPRVKGGSERLVSRRGELEPHIRGSDVEGVHVVPADFSLRHLDLHLDATKRPSGRLADLLAPLAGTYDLAILDCPPSISLASESVFATVAALVVPVVPAPLADRTLGQLAEFLSADAAAPTVWPLLSMVDRRKRLHRDVADDVRRSWPTAIAGAIPTSSAVERMGVERAPVASFAPRSPAAQAFRDAWDDVAARLWS